MVDSDSDDVECDDTVAIVLAFIVTAPDGVFLWWR